MTILPKKCNLRMPQIIFIGKPYNEQKGKPPLIRDGGGLLIGGRNVPISNNGGRPFSVGGNGSLRGSGSSPPRGNNGCPPKAGGNEPPRNQNPRSYVVRP
jgi:hypothetical protein